MPDHSSLTRIRDRYGLQTFHRFFEEIVQKCIEAGLVWGEELYFDATKVDANASLESIAPRFALEQHLEKLFEEQDHQEADGVARAAEVEDPEHLPGSNNEELIMANATRSDWISRVGRQEREVKGVYYRRTADLLVSKTDPDASPMKRKGGDHSHLVYQAHCVVDGGKSRIILGVLVAPFEVTENKPMLDMLWRAAFRWKVRPGQLTGDSAYGTPYEKALRKRRVWVEPLFAEAKGWHSLRRFTLRELEKVNVEALLIASGQNVKRLAAARDRGPRHLAQAAALRPLPSTRQPLRHHRVTWLDFSSAQAFFNTLTS